MIRFECPECRAPLTAPDANAGETGGCPHCGGLFDIPQPRRDRRRPDDRDYDARPPRDDRRTRPRRRAAPAAEDPPGLLPAWYTGPAGRVLESTLVIGLALVLSVPYPWAGVGLLAAWGGAVAAVGAAWFVAAVLRESVVFLVCVVFPPYALYYAVTHPEDAQQPIVLLAIGLGEIVLAALVFVVRGLRLT